MPDLEKVIKGLECHKRAMYGEVDEYGLACNTCPYKDMKITCKPTTEGQLIEDALALLKSQQPRVMTLGEVQEAEFVWIEQVGVIIPAIKIYTYLDGTGTMTFVHPYHDYHGIANIVNIRPCDYGKISRCWTSQPTDEQREAEPWETGTVNGEK